ncbi:MAG TPA: peptide ABC transporter substrate-binding protein [Gemmatimonadaceae bacterium]
MRKLACIIPLAVLAVACGKSEGPRSDSPNGGTLIVAMPADPVDVFPPFALDESGATLRDLVFDRLALIGPELTTVGDKGFTPQLAKSWTWSPDSLSIAFSIEPKARWHDGKPVTAADVKYSFRAFTDPKAASPVAPLLTNIDSVSVRDSTTAVVFFKKRMPEQFYDVAFQLYIVPEHVYGKVPFDSLRTSQVTRTPIGSGRFRFVSWKPDEQIELVADTANYRGRPKLDRVFLAPAADPATRATQILTGQADFVQAFPINRISDLDSSKVARALTVPTQQYAFLGLNPYAPKSRREPHPILGDIRVRRALSMAVDRAGMLRNVFGDLGRIAHGPFPMGQTASDSTIRLPPYDTAAAGALLDSLGWKRGRDGMRSRNGRPLRFSILVPTASLTRLLYAPLLQEQFHRLGAAASIDQVDYKTYLERVTPKGDRVGDFETALNTFQPDPSVSGAKQNWSTEGIGGLSGQNWMLYSNKTVDAALDSAVITFDAAKAKAYARRAFQQVADDIPAIWLYDVVFVSGVNRRLTVPPLRTDGWQMNLADWSIPAAKRIDRDKIGLTPAKKQ